jgi:transaldolase
MEPVYLRRLIDEVIHDTEDNSHAAELVYQAAAARIMEMFLPLYEESRGTLGFVTIQGDPRRDADPTAMVEEALRFQSLGKNYMAKIPTTVAGLHAMQDLIQQGVPVCATEVFSVAQAVTCSELYQRTATTTDVRPAFYVTHITGILDDYWAGIVQSEHVQISSDVLKQAGCIVAREQYRILQARGYAGIMLGGGARGVQHFTEMVGGHMCITLNWSTVRELLQLDGPVVPRMAVRPAAGGVEELRWKLPDFQRAFDEEALAPEDYEDFGPLVLFRTNFLNGYARLIDEIADRRLLVRNTAEQARGAYRHDCAGA